MKIIKASSIFLFFFFFLSLNAEDRDDLFCEPSLLFPEIFFIESYKCFSYAEANSRYSDTKELKAYLDTVAVSKKQNVYRYLYYLRQKDYLPALITLMTMVNTGTVPISIESIDEEFNNVLIGGLKIQKSESSGKSFFSADKNEMISVRQLTVNYFSALSYIASYSRQDNYGKKDSDQMIINKTFFYVLSNIQSGIDWAEDEYLSGLFNKFVYMKNNNLLESFTQFFFFYMKNEQSISSFRDYLKLREIEMVKDIKIVKNIGNRQKGSVVAEFFLENINNIPVIKYDISPNEQPDEKRVSYCKYIEERGEWIDSIQEKDPYDVFFNESVKIVEQCPGAFSMPFSLKNNEIIVYERSGWSSDIAIVMSAFINGTLTEADFNVTLKDAVVSSLIKSLDSGERTLAMDIISYANETGNIEKLFKSLYIKQLPENGEKNGQEPVTEAAKIISKILF